jgi:hypothetical protein
MFATIYIYSSLKGENPSRWLEPRVPNIGITLTNINVDPNDGEKIFWVVMCTINFGLKMH